MYCTKCGAELTEDAAYCSVCGHEVNKNKPVHGRDRASAEKQAKSKKKKTSGLLVVLLLITLGLLSFGIFNLFDLYDYYLFRTEDVGESIQIVDEHQDLPSGEEGMALSGTVQVPSGEVAYDIYYDDDTTQDGYGDRRSYYLADELVFASWDEDLDGRHDLFMEISEGLYVEAEYADLDRDGAIDEIVTFDREGEVTNVEEPEIQGMNNVNASLRFIDVLEIQDYLLVVVPVLLLLVSIPLLWKSTKGRRVAKRALSILLIVSLLGVQLSASTYAFDLYNADGSINRQVFDLEWMKYSDIDDRIPPESRSFPAQQVMQSQEQITKIQEEMARIIAEKELLRIEYATLADTKKAIASGQQENLIKAMIRLSVLTYRVGTTAASLTKIVAKYGSKAVEIATQVVETVDPVNLSLMLAVPTAAAGTAATDDEIKEAVNETIEASVDRVQATIVTNNYIKLDEAEIEILRQGYLNNRKADDDLLQNRKRYREKYDRQRFLAGEVERLLEEQSVFVAQEKERVFALLSEHAPNPEEEELPQEETAEGEGTFDFLDESPLIDSEIVEEDPETPTVQEMIVGRWKGTSTLVDARFLNSDQHTQQDIDDFNRVFQVGTETDEHWVIEENEMENHYNITFTDGTVDTVQIIGNRIVHSEQENVDRSHYLLGVEGSVDPAEDTLELAMHMEITLYNPNEGRPDYLINLWINTQMVKE